MDRTTFLMLPGDLRDDVLTSNTTLYYAVLCTSNSDTSKMYKTYRNVKRFIVQQLVSSLFGVDESSVVVLDFKGKTVQQTYLNVDEAKQVIQLGTNWLHLLYTEGMTWTINADQPPHLRMMPNVSLPYSDEYTKLREELAWRWKDIGLLYFVGVVTRQKLHARSIYTLNHPHLHQGLLQCVYDKKQIPKQLLMLSRMFLPVAPVEEVPWQNNDRFDRCVYFDIETTVSNEGKTVTNMAGLVYTNAETNTLEYRCFTSRDDTSNQECQVWILDNLPNHTIVHYTAADCIAIPEQCKRLDLYKSVQEKYMNSPDLQQLNINNFKLKTLYKQMCKRLGLANLYDECVVKNGLQAMHVLEEWIGDESNEQGLEAVRKYNRVDCVALLLLHQVLENTFSEKFKSFLNCIS